MQQNGNLTRVEGIYTLGTSYGIWREKEREANRCTKLEVPSIGSTIQVGLSVSCTPPSSTLSSPMKLQQTGTTVGLGPLHTSPHIPHTIHIFQPEQYLQNKIV